MKAELNRLLLMRHAKSDWCAGQGDFERPLASRGIKDAIAMGNWLAEIGLPDVIVCSPSRRTRETVELLSKGARTKLCELTEFVDGLYHSSTESILQSITDHSYRGSVMVIGHNPGLAQLLLWLIVDNKALKNFQNPFPTAAIYELSTTDPLNALKENSALLLSFMRPKLIEK